MPHSGLLWRSYAVVLGCLLSICLHYYPSVGLTIPLILGLSGLLLYRYPVLLCVLLPAGLASFDLAPITGWYFLEEIDLLLMLAAAVAYARLAYSPDHAAPLTKTARLGATLLAASMLYGLCRSTAAWHDADFMGMNDYLSPYIGWRSLKAWLWLLVYLPLLRKLTTRQPSLLDRSLLPGLLAGLLLVAIRASYERWQFPGLFNLSSDYRITAPFSAMHTGGAALDGYLAMSLPLLAIWLSQPARSVYLCSALLLLPLALYTALATFSRGLYLGLLLACLQSMANWRAPIGLATRPSVTVSPILDGTHYGKAGIALLLVLSQLELSFVTSGYRGMLAAGCALLLAALPANAQAPFKFYVRLGTGLLLLAALVMLAPRDATGGYEFKLPYLAFLLTVAAYLLAICRRQDIATVWLGMVLGTSLWISIHHAGIAALPYAAGQIVSCLLLRRLLRRPQTHAIGATLKPPAWLIAAMLASATIVPFLNGYFVGERFAAAGNDLNGRWQHWRDVLQIMHAQPDTFWAGAGLGQFPIMYYWLNAKGERPAHASFVRNAQAAYLELDAGSYPQGYGELLRVLQMLPFEPATPYQFSLAVAGGSNGGFLQMRVCARQLLYAAGCAVFPQQSIPPRMPWKILHFPLMSATLDSAKLPVQLELAAEGDKAKLYISRISLVDMTTGRELIRNGSFEQRHTGWFFSSDHHHLPWHIKNLFLNFYFELGAAGLTGYLLLLGSAVLSLLARARVPPLRHSSLIWLASLAAFETVGLFDSLVDVPRILFLHLLVLYVAIISRPSEEYTRHECSTP